MAFHMMTKLFPVIVGALFAAGCQIAPWVPEPVVPPTPSVMDLWDTYKHCRSAVDPTVKQVAARRLNLAAQQAMSVGPSPIPLPAALTRHVTERQPRYSVDPKAMSASCSLFAGEAALHAGQYEVAAEMFRLVLAHHPQPHYSFYVEQAKRGLIRTTPTVSASRALPSHLTAVSLPKAAAEARPFAPSAKPSSSILATPDTP